MEALREIAVAQARLGGTYFEEAVQVALLISYDRSAHVPVIAAALVAAGDRSYFTRLLLPCASSLTGALRACAVLIRAYSGQVAAITNALRRERGLK